MVERRIPVVDTVLTSDECQAALRALGSYQVHLFDLMNEKGAAGNVTSSFSAKIESDLITSAIKKIHRTLEDQNKK
jgi:hypothetical protein